ncbi:LisH domain-containing protein [Trichostrongylus colubriformis]|uniref:LisH domain-containing protein n=1 Tax=Trichostrongylus colubriformis TaxID=6319 RepID=A0AAN8FUA5_TRICO
MSHGPMNDARFDPDDYQYGPRTTVVLEPNTKELIVSPGLENLSTILKTWDGAHRAEGFDPLPTLTSIAEIIEQSIDDFLKLDPDPLDDRHPARTHPHAEYGNLLKMLFRNDDFMNKLVITYLLGRDHMELSIASARLLLDCLPGLDANVVFSEPSDFIPQLYVWAKDSSNEILRAYAIGLLAGALEVQGNAHKYRSNNIDLMPVALRRLSELKARMLEERSQAEQDQQDTTTAHEPNGSSPGPFSNVNGFDMEDTSSDGQAAGSSSENTQICDPHKNVNDLVSCELSKLRVPSLRVQPPAPPKGSPKHDSPPAKRRKKVSKNERKDGAGCAKVPSFASLHNLENSNSTWNMVQPYVIGTHKVYPLSVTMHQRFILQYLNPTGEYQDLLNLAIEGHAMDLILEYIDLQKMLDVRLTFDALRYLTSLLVHRKFAMEFIARGGLAVLVRVPRASMASVAAITAMYYLAYNDDVMEKVCQLNEKVLDELVEYALWCLEHSYESGMGSAAMFFTHGFYYKPILERFDQRDGLRKLYNYISTLTLLQEANKDKIDLTEEQHLTSSQAIRNASAAFKSYFSAHLFVKLEQIRRTVGNRILQAGCSYPAGLPYNHRLYKSMMMDEDSFKEGVYLLMTALRASNSGWKPVDDARKLGLIKTLFGVVVLAHEMGHAGRYETANNALHTLWLCSCVPKVHLELCESMRLPNGHDADGFQILMEIIGGVILPESDLRLAALRVLINCVSVPEESSKPIRSESGEKKDKDGRRSRCAIVGLYNKEAQEKIWGTVRKYNGINVLLTVIRLTFPIADADQTRALACRALREFAKWDPVGQILSKLPLITANELQGLMRQPVMFEKRAEHVKFCEEARKLIETVTKRPMVDVSLNPKDLTQERLWKSHVIANTRVSYNEKELLQLIHDHLVRKGLHSTAEQLVTEAELPQIPASKAATTPARLPPLPRTRSLALPSPQPRSLVLPGASGLTTTGSATEATTPINSLNKRFGSVTLPTPQREHGFLEPSPGRVRKPRALAFPHRLQLRTPTSSNSKMTVIGKEGVRPYKGLDDIVTEYFRVQHSKCSHPVTTCPPFSLFYPHRCPEPRNVGSVPMNIVTRFATRDVLPYNTWNKVHSKDEKYVFSRFRPSRTITEHEEMYTSCAFSIDDEHLIVGTFTGEVHWLNLETGAEESHTVCHSSGITSIVPSNDGNFLLTSSAYITPLSALWKLGDQQEYAFDIPDEYFVQFSNLSSEKIIGTSDVVGTIYDTETGRLLRKFRRDSCPTGYTHNRASFSPCDTMVLNDGVLYDVRGPVIHTFDQLNTTGCSVFHPQGNEIIINTEVWDTRTYRLLHLVPALEQCKLVFNSTGKVVYAAMYSDCADVFRNTYCASFRTFDTLDYSVIATVDTKRPLLDISCDHSDRYVAVVERMSEGEVEYMLSNEKTLVRAYELEAGSESSDNSDSEGSGWETASNPNDPAEDAVEDHGEQDDEEMNSRGSDESGGANGDNYLLQQDPREDHPTSSSTAVNPHIRRQRRGQR